MKCESAPLTGDRSKVVSNPKRTRSGMLLMVVMVAVSSSLVLTYSFLRTQTTTLKISDNGIHQDHALQAAQTGASIALETMQSLEWEGVESSLKREVNSNSDGTSWYEVTFSPLTADDIHPWPTDSLLYVVIESKGSWQSASEKDEVVEKTVKVVAKLQPRLPGRVIKSSESAAAVDVVPNPGDYDTIQKYALFSEKGSRSLVLDPGDRIKGDIWLQSGFQLYGDPRWSDTVRSLMLDNIGTQFAPMINGQRVIRHPLAGHITFGSTPSSSNSSDLGRIGTPWTVSRQIPKYPDIDWEAWQSYRLFEGGFCYECEKLYWKLSNVTKRPSSENPLGIFYRHGDLRISDNVTIQGTIVCTGRVTIEGDQVHLASYNWTESDGHESVDEARLWPRLPAIVAKEIYYKRDVQSVVDGAIVVSRCLKGAGGDLEYVDVPEIRIDGMATARPSTQPWSIVHIDKDINLSTVASNGRYSIWLQDGNSGGWYGIYKVDARSGILAVWGEVTHESPTHFKIRRNRRRYVDIRGPVAGENHDINRLPDWDLSSSLWGKRRDAWNDTNEDRKKESLDSVSFIDWLANPKNFDGWKFPYSSQGLSLEPTFHLKNTKDVRYIWSPPLFQPYAGLVRDDPESGLRWKVISWREINASERGDYSNENTTESTVRSSEWSDASRANDADSILGGESKDRSLSL